MIREFIVNSGETAITNYTAKSDFNTGAPVTVDVTKGEVNAVSATETASDIYVVDKERYAEGVYAGITNLSDYHEGFNTVKSGEKVKLCAYGVPSDSFGTTEYDSTITESVVGKRVAAKNGKWVLATTAASKYVFAGFVNDNGHKLAKIVVSDTAIKNV